MAAMPSLPSLRSTAYTGRARKRREFSMPMFSGLRVASGSPEEARYAALGLLQTCVRTAASRQKKMPLS
jgi:hypothetical protein